MPERIPVSPKIWEWACRRSGKPMDELRRKFPKLDDWMAGRSHPTMKQLRNFSQSCYAPFGYFFDDNPPDEEKLPIADMRTPCGKRLAAPSAHLLDTIYLCEQRQDWYRSYAIEEELPRPSFVGSCQLKDDPARVAAQMRETLKFGVAERAAQPSWTAALGAFIRRCDEAGILVMVSGIYGNNAKRPLSTEEFLGFALADDHAPLVFINGRNYKAAQIFTLAHELAHLWLGKSAVANSGMAVAPHSDIERWCNQVAAEFLVPEAELREAGEKDPQRLARHFKVSRLVVLYRLRSLDLIGKKAFDAGYAATLAEMKAADAKKNPSGGSFYNTSKARVSPRLERSLIARTLGGKTTFTEAMRLLSINNSLTLMEIGERYGLVR